MNLSPSSPFIYLCMLALGMLEEETALEDYLDQFAQMGEYDHKVDQPFHLMLLTNLLDLTIVKPIIESCCGYDLITQEDLTEMEQNLKLTGALVDLITLTTGLYGFTETAKTLGMKQIARLAMIELAADVTATSMATIGEYHNWPPGLTMLLSLGAGITVGQIGNHLVFRKDGIEICRKEIAGKVGSLEGNTAIEGGTSSANQYCLSGEEHYEAYKEMFGAENVEWTSRDTLSSADRLRVQEWSYPPNDELYLKYKDVYQNDLYFNQATGDIRWPIDDGFSEYPDIITLQPGTIIDRYGSNYGTFTSPKGVPYANRALAPGTGNHIVFLKLSNL